MTIPVALVTGASSGIGEATALKLKALGYTVYAAARRVDRMRALEAAGVRVLAPSSRWRPSATACAWRLSPLASTSW